MAVKTTYTAEELCPTFGTSNQTTATWYLPNGETLRVGVTVYTDQALTTKLQANKTYGATFAGVNYFFTTGANSTVATLTQCSTTVLGELSTISQFSTGIIGDSSYQFDMPTQADSSGNVWNNLTITVGVNNKLSVTIDSRGWYGSGNFLFNNAFRTAS